MSDPRTEAAARRWYESDYGEGSWMTAPSLTVTGYKTDARTCIAAADEADRAAGVVRVSSGQMIAAAELVDQVAEIHSRLAMDTPEDQALATKVSEKLRYYASALRQAVSHE